MAANWGNWPPGHEERRLLQLIFSDNASLDCSREAHHSVVLGERGGTRAVGKRPPLPAFRGEV